MVSTLSKVELARQLKEIRAPKPSLVANKSGLSPFLVHSEEVKRTTSDLNTKRRRVE